MILASLASLAAAGVLLQPPAPSPASAAPPPPPAPPPVAGPPPQLDAWNQAEGPFLTDHVQLTFPDRFARAGEAYFDHDERPEWIIFQAIPAVRDGQEPATHYAMYVARLVRRDDRIVGLDEPVLVSPEGSANTCGWFHPVEPWRVLFGSTQGAPAPGDAPGFSRDRQQYTWQFPPETRVVEAVARERVVVEDAGVTYRRAYWNEGLAGRPVDLFSPPNGPGYAAECSWSPDARHILYTYLDPQTNDPDLWVFDTIRDEHSPLVQARGYDGGPFFSPDGARIVYRSDRRGDKQLQVFIADLVRDDPDDAQRITGIARERAVTDDAFVNWAPYWHPSGRWLLMATNRQGHQNYEVYAVELDPLLTPTDASAPTPDPAPAPAALRSARVTRADGFDGLPAFSARGDLLMWTSQRGGTIAGQTRPSSQLWLARVHAQPVWETPTPALTPTPAPTTPPAPEPASNRP